MQYSEYQKEFIQALDDEIKELRKSRGQRTFLSDGTCLSKSIGRYIYSFIADSELRFPDDTPVDLEYKGKKYSGILLSIEGFDIILELKKNIGERIVIATLYTTPWFLLEKLKERLLEAGDLKGANKNLAEILLEDKKELDNFPQVNTQELLDKIQQRLQQTIRYNEYQKAAVHKVLNRQVSFIWGPPGTGKTSTLGLAVAALVQSGESVLVVAQSNTAVDTAMKSLAEYLQGAPVYQNGMVLRYGIATPGSLDKFPQLHVRGVTRQQNPSLMEEIETLEKRRKDLVKRSRHETLTEAQRQNIQNQISSVKKALQPLKQQLKQKESELIQKATVVGCTLSKAAIAMEVYQRQRPFDAVVVDEASMAYIPHCVFVSTLVKRRIAIFGDFRQLGPISQAETVAAETWLKRDIFDQTGIIQKVNKQENDSRMVLLKTQYRMHPDISKIPNHLFYAGQLEDSSGVREGTMSIVQSQPYPGSALIFCDLSKLSPFCFSDQQSHSRFNIISALIAVSLAYKNTQNNELNIGIITPYNAQSRLIQRLLQDLHLNEKSVKVATVHRFQGTERNLIIFDTVESPPQSKAGKLIVGGLKSTAMRLANVAVSRAQGKFIGLVNYQYIQQKLDSFNIFRKFIDRLKNQAHVDSLILSADLFTNLPEVTYFNTVKDAINQIKSDLQVVKEEVSIDWSSPNKDNQFLKGILQQCNNRNIRFFMTEETSSYLASGLKNVYTLKKKANKSVGLLGIDRKHLWVYLNLNLSSGPIMRINLPQTTKLLYNFLSLIPEQDPGSITEKISQNEDPFGKCPDCEKPLWYQSDQYDNFNITCLKNTAHYQRRINEKDATLIVRLMNVQCKNCNQQVKVYKSQLGNIRVKCSQRDCNWSDSLKFLI